MKNGKTGNGIDDTGEFDGFRDKSEDITKRGNPLKERLANIGIELQTLASRASEASRSVDGASAISQSDIAREILRFGEKSVECIEEYMLSVEEFIE